MSWALPMILKADLLARLYQQGRAAGLRSQGAFAGEAYERPPRTISDQVRFQIEWIDFLNTDSAASLPSPG